MISRVANRLCVISKGRGPQGLVFDGMDADFD